MKSKAIQVQVEHRFCWEWKKIFAKSVTKKNPCLPSTFSSKMPQFEMFIYFRNFLKKYLVTPYSSKGSGPENINRSSSFFSLIEKNSRHISSPIFSWFSILQRISRRKNWRLTKLFKAENPTKRGSVFGHIMDSFGSSGLWRTRHKSTRFLGLNTFPRRVEQFCTLGLSPYLDSFFWPFGPF